MDFDLLCELTETSGVPGYEDRVRDLVRRELDGVVDSIRTDAMGNVVGTVEGSTDYEVAVAAHMLTAFLETEDGQRDYSL